MPVNRRIGAVLVGVVVLTTAACGTDQSAGSTEPAEALNIGIPTAAPTSGDNNPFDPASAAARLGYRHLIYEPLVMPDLVRPDGPGMPWLATAWNWSPDGATLTMNIRDGVRFADGRLLGANDVAYTFGLIKSTPALNPDAVPYRAITTHGNTVTITFGTPPDADRAAILDTEIIPADSLSGAADPTAPTVRPPVGTGPFTVTRNDGRSVVLDLRTNYWRALPKVQEIHYTAYPDEATLAFELSAGGSDWGPVPAPLGVNHLRAWYSAPGIGASFSIRHWFGWPDARDPYAPALPTDPTVLAIILRLTPAL